MKKLINALGLIIFCNFLNAAPVEISSEKLKIIYDQQHLAFYYGGLKTAFLKDVSLDMPRISGVTVKSVKHPVFGKGKELVLRSDGDESTKVNIYESLPFVLIQKIIRNSSAQQKQVKKLQIFEGNVDLGVKAPLLKTISTAGLNNGIASVGSYMFLAVGNPQTNEGVVCAWLTANRGSGIVFSDNKEDKLFLRARIDYGDLRIPSKQVAESEILAVGYGADVRATLESYADAIAKNMKMKLPAQPTVYCTWYHGGASTEKLIAENADFVLKNLKDYGLDVMQIDDYWQKGIRKNGPRRDFTDVNPQGPYPSGMKKTASYMKEKGLTAGIWYIPFAGSWYDEFWKDKMNLFLKEGDSPNNYMDKIDISPKPDLPKGERPFDAFWGGTCLDLTNPQSQAYVAFIANRFSNEWGFKYFKMDGLWTGTGTRIQYVNSGYKDDDLGMQRRFNPLITPIEGYANGLATIRKAAGKEVFLLGCCLPQNMRSFGPAMGRVDAMRVGPDNGANMDGLIRGPQFGSRVYFLNKRVWYNDPDPGYPRATFPLELAQTSLSWIALTGSLHATSEQYAELPAERLDLLRKTMPSHELKTVRPVDYLENDPPRVWLLTDSTRAVRKDIIGLFNFDKINSVNVSYPLHKMELPKADSYVGFDFWGNKFLPPFNGEISGLLAPGACKIISIRPVKDYPQVVSTSRHVTQGVIDLTNEKWDAATRSLSGTSQLMGNDPYELRIVSSVGNSTWLIDKVEVNTTQVSTSFSQSGSFSRVKLATSNTQKVNWVIRFRKGVGMPPKAESLKVESMLDLDQVVVKWNDASPFHYRISKNGKILGEIAANMFVDKDVKPGQSYTYGVEIKDEKGIWLPVVESRITMPETYQVPPVPPLPQINCTELKPVEKAAYKLKKSFADNPVIWKEKVQENAIGVQPGKSVIYEIPAGATQFVSTVVMEGEMGKGAKCVYAIMGDVMEMGEPPVELGRSPQLGAGDEWNFQMTLDKRYKRITLISHIAGTPDGATSINWINPGFLK